MAPWGEGGHLIFYPNPCSQSTSPHRAHESPKPELHANCAIVSLSTKNMYKPKPLHLAILPVLPARNPLLHEVAAPTKLYVNAFVQFFESHQQHRSLFLKSYFSPSAEHSVVHCSVEHSVVHSVVHCFSHCFAYCFAHCFAHSLGRW